MKYTDIKLICANKDEIPTNKALLAAKSPVFAKILTEADVYEIGENFSKEAVMEFLRFLYSNTISIDKFDANTVELLQMASKYEVPDLVKMCQQDLLHGCKAKMDFVYKKFEKLSCKEISWLQNFADITRCIKDLYKQIKIIE